jgi:hypothetical protein
MRWPFMLKKTHRQMVDEMLEAYQQVIDQEYVRAMHDCRAAVHAWAVEATAEFFQIDMYRAKGAAVAAFQEAERMFAPNRTDVKEALDAAVRS